MAALPNLGSLLFSVQLESHSPGIWVELHGVSLYCPSIWHQPPSSLATVSGWPDSFCVMMTFQFLSVALSSRFACSRMQLTSLGCLISIPKASYLKGNIYFTPKFWLLPLTQSIAVPSNLVLNQNPGVTVPPLLSLHMAPIRNLETRLPTSISDMLHSVHLHCPHPDSGHYNFFFFL